MRAPSLLVGCLLAVAPGVGRAQTENAGQDPLERATAASALGHHAVAAESYEKAFEAKPAPALLYNAADEHRLAGNKQRALELYESYLRLYGKKEKKERRAEVGARIAELQQAIEQDRQTAATPAVAAEPVVVVPPPGYAQAPPPPAALPPPAYAPAPPPPAAGTPPLLVTADRVERPRRGLGIGLTAAGGALIGTGIVFGLSARKAGEDVSVQYDESKAAAGPVLEKIGLVADVVGLAAVVTGIVLISHTRRVPAVGLRANVSGDQGILGLGGTF